MITMTFSPGDLAYTQIKVNVRLNPLGMKPVRTLGWLERGEIVTIIEVSPETEQYNVKILSQSKLIGWVGVGCLSGLTRINTDEQE